MQGDNSSSGFKRYLSGISAFFLSMYIYCAHFNYPFSPTLLLYIGVFGAGILLIYGFRVPVSKSVNRYLCILLITAFGCLYSNDAALARRQLIFFSVYLIILWLTQKSRWFVESSQKLMFAFSFLGMLSVYVQFLFPGPMNILIKMVFRESTYEDILWSYDVDGSFTGLTPSVSMASFSMAVVFFIYSSIVLKYFFLTNSNDVHGKKGRLIFPVGALVFSILGIILTNKRGIFLAVIMAFILSLLLDKNLSIKKLTNNRLLVLFALIFIAILASAYYISENEQVAHFMSRFQNHGQDILTGRGEYYQRAIEEYMNGDVFTMVFGKGTASAYAINSTGIHNVYLQILYDHGLVGIVFYLGFFIGNFKKAVKNRYYYSMSLQLVFLVYCMSGNPLYDYFFFIPYLLNSQYEG